MTKSEKSSCYSDIFLSDMVILVISHIELVKGYLPEDVYFSKTKMIKVIELLLSSLAECMK